MKIKLSTIQSLLLSLIICSGFSVLMPLRIYMICIFLMISLYLNLKNRNGIIKNKISFALMVFLLLILLGMINSYDRTETIKYFITFAAGATLILFPNTEEFEIKTLHYIEMFLKVIALSILVQIIIPNLYKDYLYFFISGGASARARSGNEISQHIFSGIVGEKGEAAFLMVIAIIILLSKTAYKKRMDKKVFLWLCIYFVALLLPAKRMLFAIGVMILMLFLIMWTKGSKKVIAIASAGLFGGVAYIMMSVIPTFNTLLYRFTTFADNDDTANGRTYLWDYAMQMFHNKPVLGYGYGSYNKYASGIGVVLTSSRDWVSQAHNIYYQLLAEMGIVGLISFLFLNLTVILLALRIYKKRNNLPRIEFEFIFIGFNIVLLTVVYGLTGNVIYYTNQIMTYMWGISLIVYVSRSLKALEKGK